jgi:DNA-binding CsgD family transcriptional regulator
MTERPTDLASDADRDRVVSELHEHFASGRLTIEELSDRTERALQARNTPALEHLLADLPKTQQAPGLRDGGLRLHLALFIIFGGGLVALWEFTRDQTPTASDEGAGYYWPFWVLIVWVFALALHGAWCFFGWLPRKAQEGLRSASGGRTELDPTATDARSVAPQLDNLTPREREILVLVGQALSNKDIARELGISERTARTHVSNLLRKLGLTSRTEAALLASRARIAVRE